MSTVSYRQSDNLGEVGEITLDGVTRNASGRLDAVGDVVFASFSGGVTVVCERDASDSMRITIQFEEFGDSDYGSPYDYGYPTGTGEEIVLPTVPLSFS